MFNFHITNKYHTYKLSTLAAIVRDSKMRLLLKFWRQNEARVLLITCHVTWCNGEMVTRHDKSRPETGDPSHNSPVKLWLRYMITWLLDDQTIGNIKGSYRGAERFINSITFIFHNTICMSVYVHPLFLQTIISQH